MKKNAEAFLSKTLGSDFLESLGTSLSKSEVYKPGSKTLQIQTIYFKVFK